jgi:hypothetical protein
MPTWTPQELSSLDRAHEIRVAGRRKDRSLRSLVPVWNVVVDGALYARSVKGTEGQWYKGVTQHFEGAVNWGGQTRDVTYTLDDSHDAAIDAAYAAKYGKGSATRAITSAAATETALRIDPM